MFIKDLDYYLYLAGSVSLVCNFTVQESYWSSSYYISIPVNWKKEGAKEKGQRVNKGQLPFKGVSRRRHTMLMFMYHWPNLIFKIVTVGENDSEKY